MRLSLIISIFLLTTCSDSNRTESHLASGPTFDKGASFSEPFVYGEPLRSEQTPVLLSDFNTYSINNENEKLDLRNQGIDFFRIADKLSSPYVDKINALSSDSDLPALIQELNNYFDELSSEPSLYLIKQMIGAELQSFLITDANHTLIKNNYATELLAYNTQLLIDNGSPNTDIIAKNLELLESHFSEAELKSYAKKCVSNANRWIKQQDEYYSYELSNQKKCIDCGSELSTLIKELNKEPKRASILKGISILQTKY